MDGEGGNSHNPMRHGRSEYGNHSHTYSTWCEEGGKMIKWRISYYIALAVFGYWLAFEWVPAITP